jgi:hypothetical protein
MVAADASGLRIESRKAATQARETERMAAQYGLRQQIRPDIIRARLKYNVNGQPMEEWVIVRMVVMGSLGPLFNMARGGMTQAFSYACKANAIA